MFSSQLFVVLGCSIITLSIYNCDGFCVFFKSLCSIDKQSRFTLTFSVINTCTHDISSVHRVTVGRESNISDYRTYCYITTLQNGSYYPTAGCNWNSHSGEYSVSHPFEETESEVWKLTGVMWNKQKIAKTGVEISQKHCSEAASATTEDGTLSTKAVSKQSVTDTVPETVSAVNTPDQTDEPGHELTQYERLKLLITGIVSVIAISVVIILVFMMRSLRQSVNKIKTRPSSKCLTRNEPEPLGVGTHAAVLSKALYSGSNVSLMVNNDLYVEGPCDQPGTPRSIETRPRMPLPTPPSEIDSRGRLPLPDTPANVDGIDMTTATEWNARPMSGEEGDYTEISSLVGDTSEEGACGGYEVYTDVEEMRRQKQEQL